MLGNLTGWHFLIILVIILLLFGAPKLPGLARSLGQSAKIFKSEIKPEEKAGNDATSTPADPIDTAIDKSAANTSAADSTSTKS
ncbi:MAG: sec-independent protein translocase protein TatA [Actinomycetota bacterium]|jgi:sec-independent protein translocase protein TatA|nr:sec-independent protein translocase protein TatA [Actinomycetota bacterium]